MNLPMRPSESECGSLISRRVLIVIAIWRTTMKQIAKAILFPFVAIVCGLAELFGVHDKILQLHRFQWKTNVKGGSFSGLCFKKYSPAMFLNNYILGYGQTLSRPFSYVLCGEKRIENS